MESKHEDEGPLLTFGGHLEVLRGMLFRVVLVVTVLAVVIFMFKEQTFRMLLAPGKWDFVTYRYMEACIRVLGFDFEFAPFQVNLISTELASQFMVHLSSSLYLALLGASPYLLYEVFRFVSPALYASEKRYALLLVVSMYALFACGVLMSYYLVFPISFRFLGTYQVDASVVNTITLASYIGAFTTLTFMLGLLFQLPVVAFGLARLGVLSASFMQHYRRHAFIVILTVAAFITPSVDMFTLALVTLPIYGLYELCIMVVRRVERD